MMAISMPFCSICVFGDCLTYRKWGLFNMSWVRFIQHVTSGGLTTLMLIDLGQVQGGFCLRSVIHQEEGGRFVHSKVKLYHLPLTHKVDHHGNNDSPYSNNFNFASTFYISRWFLVSCINHYFPTFLRLFYGAISAYDPHHLDLSRSFCVNSGCWISLSLAIYNLHPLSHFHR